MPSREMSKALVPYSPKVNAGLWEKFGFGKEPSKKGKFSENIMVMPKKERKHGGLKARRK